jgi:hypothetical protein
VGTEAEPYDRKPGSGAASDLNFHCYTKLCANCKQERMREATLVGGVAGQFIEKELQA